MTTEHPTPPIWCIMPVLGARDYTVTAIADLLAQTLPVKILVVNQGVDDDFRDELERIAEAHPERVFVWHHVPPLPSLAATWNRALDFVWAVGGEVALVVNNDVRVPRQLVEILATVRRRTDALFVSAVGVREPDYQSARVHLTEEIDALTWADETGDGYPTAPGGPDFSCFLIAIECHAAYRFDEGFVPAYCEDLDYHRRVLLAGGGPRLVGRPVGGGTELRPAHGVTPFSIAQTMSWALLPFPTFARMRLVTVLAVSYAIPSLVAIWAYVRPATMPFRTSVSRGVRVRSATVVSPRMC
jgi:hypothetical protein